MGKLFLVALALGVAIVRSPVEDMRVIVLGHRAFLDVAESFSKQKGGRYMFQPDR